uniref:HYDIN/VesB/CFA65-like Ig-like domain-containing protein n=1 Tax=Taeniopygia guttata TaxID=59729 RepID=H1A105_TAEGU
MASGFREKILKPCLWSREALKSFSLLPSKSLWEKFFNTKKKASTAENIAPRTGPFLDMSKTGQKLSSVPPKQNLLQISPPEVVFQGFVAHEVSEMVVSLVNKDKDYSHKLICTTARERIVVPIQAIGARAILEFPDQLDFSECPVKQSSHKTLLVHNVSNRAVHYQLSTQSPFSVVPATGTVGAGDTVQVTVGFHALMTGDYSGSLCCNTGEESTHTELHAEAVELNIGLSTNVVAVETTFITMSNHKTMFIENRSNVTAHFQWKAFPTKEGENREKRRQCRFLRPWSEKSQENLTEEETSESEMGSCEDHTARLSNTVLAEIAKVQQDPMLFSDDIFFIEPVEGEIGPNSSAEIKVTFKPTEALEYQSVAYCNISGRESRLPLRLRGHGKGPLVELNCRILNLGNVSVNTPHVREVQLVNLGAIDAPFTYISSNANVGFCFKFAPKEGIIAPGGTQTIQVSFGATVLGTFEEEFQFSVAGSPRPAILTIKGSVTGPTSLSDTIKLNLEDISSGECSLGWDTAWGICA